MINLGLFVSRASSFQTARAILQEMKKDSTFTIEQVLRSPYLKDGDDQLFQKVRMLLLG
jgi:hypothetical protein